MSGSTELFKRGVIRLLEENRSRQREPADQSELARRLGVKSSQVNKILRQDGSPTLETVDRFAHALGVTPADLFRAAGDHSIEECLRRVSEHVDAGKKFLAQVKKP